MQTLKEYFNLQKQIFDYFGYKEDWKIIPLNDSTEYFWKLKESEVLYSYFYDDLTNETGAIYANEFYKTRLLPKYIYRSEDYTMIVVDTHCDGNKLLQIFSNEKEMKHYNFSYNSIKKNGIDYDLSACLEYNPQDFDISDIEKVLAVHKGESGYEDWRWIIQLKKDSVKEKSLKGEFVYLIGGCDYTGWDCQSWARSRFSTTASGAIPSRFTESEEIFNELMSKLEAVK